MNITKYSKNHFLRIARDWDVEREHVDVIYNYLINGFSPGSFFTAVLANDFFRAMQSSHPANNIVALKNLTGWIRSTMGHGIFWGSEEIVRKWLEMTEKERRDHLEALNLVYPEKDEIIMVLKGRPTQEPHFW